MNIGIWDEGELDGFCDAIAERIKSVNITEKILYRYALFCTEESDRKDDLTAFLAWNLAYDERVKNES